MPKPLTALLTRVQQPADWIIPNLLKRCNTMFILGEPKKAAKSWLLFNLGWDLTDGITAWNVTHSTEGDIFKPDRPMRILYFSQEDTEDDLQDRFKLMVAAGRIPNPNFFYETKDLNFAFDDGPGEERIHASIAACAPIDLVMFDPMRRIHYFDENDSQAIARFWKSLNRMEAKFNCATCFSHHLTKPSKDAIDRTSPHAARGSTDIFGGADAFINVVPRPKVGNPQKGAKSAALRLHFESKRARPRVPIDLTVSFTTGLVTFDGFAP